MRAICKPEPYAKAYINKKEMKINKVKLIDNAPNYKSIIGSLISKTPNGFNVKTSDSFIKVTEFEFDGIIKIGDRFRSTDLLSLLNINKDYSNIIKL